VSLSEKVRSKWIPDELSWPSAGYLFLRLENLVREHAMRELVSKNKNFQVTNDLTLVYFKIYSYSNMRAFELLSKRHSFPQLVWTLCIWD
jgi:hypothetical protein